MKFFIDCNIPKDHSIGITNLLINITTKDHSHKGGWAKLLKCQLINTGYTDVNIIGRGESFSSYDSIIFDLGAEYAGVLNMFGGLGDQVFSRLLDIKSFEGEILSWQHDLPSIMPLNKRYKNASTCDGFKATDKNFIQTVQTVLDKCKKFDHVEFKPHLLFGDSHTPSVWTPDMMIERQDGRTLYGSIKKEELHNKIIEYNEQGMLFDAITVYMGNIDIRHHINRQEKDGEALLGLLQDYADMVKGYQNVTLVDALPIENESRVLSKSGYYKGTPFAGSWEKRDSYSKCFNSLLKLNAGMMHINFNIYNHPQKYYNESGELTFDVMEKPKSVHVSPAHYRWDLDNNKRRY